MRELPSKDTIAILERGLPHFRGGAAYPKEAEAARREGHERPAQFLLDRVDRCTLLWSGHASGFLPA